MKMTLIHMLLVILAIAVLLVPFAWAMAINSYAKPNQPNQPKRHRGLRRTWRKLYLLPVGIHRLIGFMPGHRLNYETQFANIGSGTFETGVRSMTPDAATTARYLIYKIGTDGDHCALAGAGDVPIGQSDDQADAGIPIAINLFGAKPGTLRVVTDGTIANGDYVKTAANGKATKATNGDAGQFGRALFGTDTSSADGDVITVVHVMPSKIAF